MFDAAFKMFLKCLTNSNRKFTYFSGKKHALHDGNELKLKNDAVCIRMKSVFSYGRGRQFGLVAGARGKQKRVFERREIRDWS